MGEIICEFRTEARKPDLTGACPGKDWKGDSNFGRIIQMLSEMEINWTLLAEMKLEKLDTLPKGTRVTRLYYNVLLSVYSPWLKEYAKIDHCDFPNALARQMADDDQWSEAVTGTKLEICASVEYPDGEKDECYVIDEKDFKLKQYDFYGTIITPQQEDKKKFSYSGSSNIKKLLKMAIDNQEWNDPHSLPLSDYPLNPTELSSLFERSSIKTTLTVSLGRCATPPTDEYMTLSADDFPQKLADKLLADDNEGLLDDVTSMKITALVKIEGEEVTLNLLHTLENEDPEMWNPIKWNVCVVTIDWRADRFDDCASKSFARPRSGAIHRYPVMAEGQPLRITSKEMKGAATNLFPTIEVVKIDDDGITIQYGPVQHHVTIDKPFCSDPKGVDYTTFQLSVEVIMESVPTRLGFSSEALGQIESLYLKNYTCLGDPCVEAQQLMCKNHWANAFDLIYSPTIPANHRQHQLLLRFGSIDIAANALTPDQVYHLKVDSRQPENVMAKYLYATWLLWNATGILQLREMEELFLAAAQGGEPNGWWKLSYMWRRGLNHTGRINIDKAKVYEQKALDGKVVSAICNLTVRELIANGKEDEALKILHDLVSNAGGEEWVMPMVFTYMSDCYKGKGDKEMAIKLVSKTIDYGDPDSGYWSKMDLTCLSSDGLPLPGKEDIYLGMIDEAAAAGSNYGLVLKAMSLFDQVETLKGSQRNQLEKEARIMLEKSALLGNDMACWYLGYGATCGEYGFKKKSLAEAFPYFLRGVFAGHALSAYYLYGILYEAFSDKIPNSSRELKLPQHYRPASLVVHRNLAMSYYELEGLDWPDHDPMFPEEEDPDDSDDWISFSARVTGH